MLWPDLDSTEPVERAEDWGQYTRPLPVRRCVSYAPYGALAVRAMPYPGPAASRGVKPRGRRARGSPGMPPSNDTIREIAKALRRHVDRRRWRRSSMNRWTCPATRAFGTRLKRWRASWCGAKIHCQARAPAGDGRAFCSGPR